MMPIRVGDKGRAASPLYPSGRVFIGTVPMAARAEQGPIDHGMPIVVVGGDRFSLLVRELNADEPASDLPRFGEPVLTAKEEAAVQAAELEETRRLQEQAHRRVFRRIILAAMCVGFVCGLGLMLVENSRSGFSERLLWIPILSAVSWSSVVFLAFSLGVATESLLVFVSIPLAIAGMVLGMIAWGPFAAIGVSLAVGVISILVALIFEAMRQPMA